MTRSTDADLAVFESHRALLVAHAYRMLGDRGRGRYRAGGVAALGRQARGGSLRARIW
jgi:hypothetical protein